MITAKVSCTKKRPNTEQYSSDAFSATLEVELPDAAFLNGNGELRESLNRLFKEVEAQVNHQINGNGKNHGTDEKPSRGLREARETPVDDGGARNRVSGDGQRLEPPQGGSNGGRARAPRNGGNGSQDTGDVASNKQINYLIGLATREAKMTLPELRAYVQRQVRKDDIYSLSKAEASAIIDTLKNGG